jgi:uncharacterized protein YqgC (DUF456 family)
LEVVKRAVWGTAFGTIIGLITLGPIGIVFGSFFGATIAELLNGLNLKQAVRTRLGFSCGSYWRDFFQINT